jgi:hypothetical protein
MQITVAPTEVMEGDTLLNLGTVLQVRTEGVFTSVEVSYTEWSLSTGRGIAITQHRTYHVSDEVTVDRQPSLLTPEVIPSPAPSPEPRCWVGCLMGPGETYMAVTVLGQDRPQTRDVVSCSSHLGDLCGNLTRRCSTDPTVVLHVERR